MADTEIQNEIPAEEQIKPTASPPEEKAPESQPSVVPDLTANAEDAAAT
eukprot:CAMPEP_0201565388 /NCGR_PEP_ID=MMETSP0190_2-20130828/4490_1 /ASSEMBLY_ACC=CAM_ASM_000263 /TAXON_ID=37353 /ORGANISM="Rosalina sp." /LENGTH=48 /DNA_ID= /DNA_START= /DNA_END= /DNA_ORIENTATION=